MVVIMKREFTPEQLEAAVHTMEEGGVKVMVSKGGGDHHPGRGGQRRAHRPGEAVPAARRGAGHAGHGAL